MGSLARPLAEPSSVIHVRGLARLVNEMSDPRVVPSTIHAPQVGAASVTIEAFFEPERNRLLRLMAWRP